MNFGTSTRPQILPRGSMKKLTIVCALTLSLSLPAQNGAPEVTTKDLCLDAYGACQSYNDALVKSLEKERELNAKLVEQRDAAVAKQEEPNRTPWYFWVIIGLAGGVVLTRGIR